MRFFRVAHQRPGGDDRNGDKYDINRVCKHIKKKTPGKQDLPLVRLWNLVINKQEQYEKYREFKGYQTHKCIIPHA